MVLVAWRYFVGLGRVRHGLVRFRGGVSSFLFVFVVFCCLSTRVLFFGVWQNMFLFFLACQHSFFNLVVCQQSFFVVISPNMFFLVQKPKTRGETTN